MREKFVRFMYGRYGLDQFSKDTVLCGDWIDGGFNIRAVKHTLSGFACGIYLCIFPCVFKESCEALSGESKISADDGEASGTFWKI